MAGDTVVPSARQEAVNMAMNSQWEDLRKLVDADASAAQQVDTYGMLPLHWACTDPAAVSTSVLLSLLKAYPMGARTQNTAGRLPLQIAVRAKANIEWLQALLASYPDAVCSQLSPGENVVDMAKRHRLPAASIRLLEDMQQHVSTLSMESFEPTLSDEYESSEDEKYTEHTSSMTQSSSSTSMASTESRHPMRKDSYTFQRSLPPRWTNDTTCYVCHLKFGTFKKRHHCRNCGRSICREHSARERMPLPHYGLTEKYRVCTICCNTLLTQPESVEAASAPMKRRSDEKPRTERPAAPIMTQPPTLSRNASAPMIKPEESGQSMQDQVASLQEQVARLMEEKRQAEEQLRTHRANTNAQDTEWGRPRSVDEKESRRSSGAERPHSQPRKFSNSTDASTIERSSSEKQSSRMQSTGSRGGYDTHPSAVEEPKQQAESFRPQEDSMMGGTDSMFGEPSFMYSEVDVKERNWGSVADLHDDDYDDDDYDDTSSLEDINEEEEEEEDEYASHPEILVLINMGKSLLAKGSTAAAVQAFEQATELRPRDAKLQTHLARAYYASNKLEKAKRAIQRALQDEPSASNTTLYGEILFDLGERDRAVEAYEQAMRLQS